jgi:hypothetical protein
MPSPWSLVCAAVLPLAAGCYQRSTTELRVRDPGGVTVRVDTPQGQREILPAGRTPADVEIPKTEPPYAGYALFEAHALRRGDGAIRLQCDACLGAPLETVMPPDGHVSYPGAPEDRLTWNDDTLVMRFDHFFAGPGRFPTYRVAYSASLVTPLANVVEVRQKVTTDEDDLSLGVSILLNVAFLSMMGAGIYGVTQSDSSLVDALSVTGLVIGGLAELVCIPLLSEAIFAAAHPDTDTVLYPR